MGESDIEKLRVCGTCGEYDDGCCWLLNLSEPPRVRVTDPCRFIEGYVDRNNVWDQRESQWKPYWEKR